MAVLQKHLPGALPSGRSRRTGGARRRARWTTSHRGSAATTLGVVSSPRALVRAPGSGLTLSGRRVPQRSFSPTTPGSPLTLLGDSAPTEPWLAALEGAACGGGGGGGALARHPLGHWCAEEPPAPGAGRRQLGPGRAGPGQPRFRLHPRWAEPRAGESRF